MTVEATYRRFLLATAAVTYLAAAAELLLVGHYEGVWQLIPFAMIGVGLGAVAWAWAAPGPASLRALAWAGAVVVAGTVLGVGLHVKGNVEFALEVEPGLGVGAAVWKGMSGVSPLLAPGMLALAGVLGMAAGWRHPAQDGLKAG